MGAEGGVPPPILWAKSYLFCDFERDAKIQNRSQTPSVRKVSGRKKKKERKNIAFTYCSLTHRARTPPAVNPGITIWVNEIELEKKKEKKRKKIWLGDFLEGQFFLKFFMSNFFLNEIEFERN